jgi:hypothetical protein
MPYSVTPDIFSAGVSNFNGGASFPSGVYTLIYVNGAMKLSAGNGYSCYSYVVTDGVGNTLAAPGIVAQYATQALCEAANGGMQVTYNHAGGTIGVYLQDSPYNDNVAGAPNPTYRLDGPAPPPAPTLTAFGVVIGSTAGISVQGH